MPKHGSISDALSRAIQEAYIPIDEAIQELSSFLAAAEATQDANDFLRGCMEAQKCSTKH